MGTRDAYLRMISSFEECGPAGGADASVKLSALGQALPGELAVDHAREICAAAGRVGMTVTLDMEDHTTVDSTLEILGSCGATSVGRCRGPGDAAAQ